MLKETSSTHELLAALKRGQDEACIFLFPRYREPWEGFARAKCNLSDIHAKDAAREAFIIVASRIARYDELIGQSKSEAWINTVARNAMRDYARKIRRMEGRESQADPVTLDHLAIGRPGGGLDDADDPMVLAEMRELGEALASTFTKLPPWAQKSIQRRLSQRGGPENKEWAAARRCWGELLLVGYPSLVELHYGTVGHDSTGAVLGDG